MTRRRTDRFVHFAVAQGGSTAVEAALIIPALLALTFVALFFCYVFFVQHELDNAVESGARFAMINGSTSTAPATSGQIANVVKQASSFLSASRITVTTTYSPNNAPGSQVTVAADYNVPVFGLIPRFTDLPVHESAGMTIVR